MSRKVSVKNNYFNEDTHLCSTEITISEASKTVWKNYPSKFVFQNATFLTESSKNKKNFAKILQ